VVADALSRRYENDEPGDIQALHEFVNANTRLDPDGEDTPGIPANAAQAENAPRRSHRLQEKLEPRTAEAGALQPPIGTTPTTTSPLAEGNKEGQQAPGDDPEATDGRNEAPPPVGEDLLNTVCAAYASDTKFGRIVANMGQHPDFTIREGLLYFSHRELLCVPEARLNTRRVAEIIIDTAHTAVGHMGRQRTLASVR
jgi:hypothetical protein